MATLLHRSRASRRVRARSAATLRRKYATLFDNTRDWPDLSAFGRCGCWRFGSHRGSSASIASSSAVSAAVMPG